MAKRDTKLKSLLKVLELREQAAQRQLATRIRAVDEARVKADELDNLRQEYSERLAVAGSGGFTAAEARLWRRFTHSLGDVMEVQTSRVDQLAGQLDEAQRACTAARARRRGGELLEDARLREQDMLERRKERVQSADVAARRGRNRSSDP